MLSHPITTRDSVTYVYRPDDGRRYLERLRNLRPAFALVVAYTATVQEPELSAAGVTPELREFTAAADAEILAHGRALCLASGVPSHPSGIPGPSIITRAAFDLLPGMPYVCVDAGLQHAPQVTNLVRLDGAAPAQSVTTGRALVAGQAERLFAAGCELGEKLGRRFQAEGRYLTIAESVPGGTTTALGLLLALGVDAANRVSSSMPGNAHVAKLEAIQEGFAEIGYTPGDFRADPLAAASAVGDPMQPAVAGMVAGASPFCPIVLGGGTQMAAVLALIAALGQPAQAALVTTRWVSSDPTADLAGLAGAIEDRFGSRAVPYLATNLDFSLSQYPVMRAYEQGFVKEGVGAGAAALAACLAHDYAPEVLLPHIEHVYERLVLGKEVTER